MTQPQRLRARPADGMAAMSAGRQTKPHIERVAVEFAQKSSFLSPKFEKIFVRFFCILAKTPSAW